MSHQKYHLNPAFTGMRCISCQLILPVDDYFDGCPKCLAEGTPANVAPVYETFPATVAAGRMNDWLVYTDPPTLGEGNTPLIELSPLSEELEIAKVLIKNEGANPTGSHKDRMSALVVKRAVEVGASTIAVASSGNAGVSVAAYATRAGLDCVVITSPGMSPNWRRAAEFHGATLLATKTADERWHLLGNRVKTGEWYPATNYLIPAVGSNPFGVDGYRSIAFELFHQLGMEQPSDIVVPTSRADLIWGIARGYQDLIDAGLLKSSPQIHVAEPFPRISRVLAGTDYREKFDGASKMVSIGGSTVTKQAFDALQLSGGTAVTAEESMVVEDQKRLAKLGLYLELSSAAALSALRQLIKNGTVKSNASVVLIATSHGYKEYETFEAPIKLVEANSQ